MKYHQNALIKKLGHNRFCLSENEGSVKVWIGDDEQPQPIELFVTEAELSEAKAELDALAYKELRRAEYPDMADYIDGLVKGDQAQMDKYVADCLAVKTKYPKPIEGG